MIPKKIHYCWFGGAPLPDLVQKCITSWQEHCPEYEIIRWDESNFDLNCCDYVKEAYQAQKWAFVSDVARLYALVTYGGIYMDTDMELLKPLDDILQYEAFSGFESEQRIPTGLMACKAGHPFFQELLRSYNTIHFFLKDGSYDLTTNVTRITNTCLKYGLMLNNTFQTINGFTLFPKDYFCPKDCETGILNMTNHTYAIHHFDGSWLSFEDKIFLEYKKKYQRFLPLRLAGYWAKFKAASRCRGLRSAIHDTMQWIKKP